MRQRRDTPSCTWAPRMSVGREEFLGAWATSQRRPPLILSRRVAQQPTRWSQDKLLRMEGPQGFRATMQRRRWPAKTRRPQGRQSLLRATSPTTSLQRPWAEARRLRSSRRRASSRRRQARRATGPSRSATGAAPGSARAATSAPRHLRRTTATKTSPNGTQSGARGKWSIVALPIGAGASMPAQRRTIVTRVLRLGRSRGPRRRRSGAACTRVEGALRRPSRPTTAMRTFAAGQPLGRWPRSRGAA
mmetsp:Transcript_9224/g.25147  ORF Transcript_9224/g.25147 Transcript_9224/m.25147 type:complete len:247 (-) Transcript_9224:380-1120(-)